MYAIAFVRYRRPLDEVLVHLEAHRAYLRDLQARGVLLGSGPLEPRHGGALLLRVPDDGAPAALDRIRDDDPFTRNGVAQYEIWPWVPNIGREGLDRL
ncbi:MAG: YciI family protein [Candidatus Polarisedimenticolia bacterium]